MNARFKSWVTHFKEFILGKTKIPLIPLKPKENIKAMLQEAVTRRAGVHVICEDRDYTGEILKLDQEKAQLILKHFTGGLTTIIPFTDIKKVNILPSGVRQIQSRR